MTAPVDRPLVRVRVAPHETRELKIVWTEGEWDIATYQVDHDMLQRMSTRVRSGLQALVKQAREESIKQCGRQLKELAQAGHDLYEALFTASDGRQIDAEHAKGWLLRDQPRRIHFTVESRVHIPWGLVFSSDPDTLPGGPEDIDIHQYREFWCLKYWLSTMYHRIPPSATGDPIRGDSFQVLPVFNRTVLDSTLAKLNADEQDALKQHFLARNPVYSKRELFERWKAVADQHGLVYFVCHASGTSLELGDNDLITIDDIRLKLKRKDPRDERTACMVFLNGCFTAVGESGGGFLEATGNPGFLGFIGTETKVPDIFAMRFGLAFVRELLQTGDPLFWVVDVLRRRHWPLGLLYSIYCFPLLRVVPAGEAAALPGPDGVNYCDLQLGTNDL